LKSSSRFPFAKYQGLGNDFLIVDLREVTGGLTPEASDESGFYLARKLCDRRLGVGGDGVLTLGPPANTESAATMRVLNADGSEAEMCGNGLRCVASYLLEQDASRPEAITIDTGAGALRCEASWNPEGVEQVTVGMGRPRLTRAEIPMLPADEERCLESPYTLEDRQLHISAVSMGNPHAVSFVPEEGEELMHLAMTLGPLIEKHSDFPQRTNAEFAKLHSRSKIDLVVWERGVGITQACGTGACATVVAACLAGHCDTEDEVAVALPGGTLHITVAGDYSQVWMRGPARRVFSGSVDLEEL
jgi:diaminopimelate epimerase